MVDFIGALDYQVNTERSLGATGGPWEFNLRDLQRWCDLVLAAVDNKLRQTAARDHTSRPNGDSGMPDVDMTDMTDAGSADGKGTPLMA